MLKTSNIQDIYPMSPMQAGMYFYSLYNRASSAYFEQISYCVDGALNVDTFNKSLLFLFNRHEILRTVFNHKKVHEPLQVVLKEVPIEIDFEDISLMKQQSAYIKQFKTKDKRRGFNLNEEILMRVKIFKTSEHTHQIIWSYHHILMDGWSVGIFLDEFHHAYTKFLMGSAPVFAPARQYKNYIKWIASQNRTASLDYWHNYLSDYSRVSGFPKQHPSFSDYDLKERIFEIPSLLVEDLNKLASENNSTISNLLQAVWGILLAKYNGNQDAIFGLVVSGRPSDVAGAENMIGLFINTIPLRVKFDENSLFTELVDTITKEATESMPYRYCQLAEIQSATILNKNLLDHILVFDNYPVVEHISEMNAQIDNDRSFTVSGVESFEQTNYDLNILINLGDVIKVKFKFNQNQYDEQLIKQIWSNFMKLIDQVVKNAGCKIGDLSIVTGEERAHLLNIPLKKSGLDDSFFKTFPEHDPGETKVYVLDSMQKLVPYHVPGAIYLSMNLADKQITQEHLYQPDPFEPGHKMIETGFVGQWNSTGRIDFLGRTSDYAFVNGCRVAKREIEQILLQHEEVHQVRLIERENELILFYTGTCANSATIIDFIAEKVPDYYLPSCCHQLDEMPLTPQGEIDESVLQSIRAKGETENGEAQTTSMIEQQLLRIWKEVLKREQINVNDNFFKIAGNSIKATQIVSRMYKEGMKVSLKSIFTYPTIRELAALLAISEDVNTSTQMMMEG